MCVGSLWFGFFSFELFIYSLFYWLPAACDYHQDTHDFHIIVKHTWTCQKKKTNPKTFQEFSRMIFIFSMFSWSVVAIVTVVVFSFQAGHIWYFQQILPKVSPPVSWPSWDNWWLKIRHVCLFYCAARIFCALFCELTQRYQLKRFLPARSVTRVQVYIFWAKS